MQVYERTVYRLHQALANNLRFLGGGDGMSCASASSDGLLKAIPTIQRGWDLKNSLFGMICFVTLIETGTKMRGLGRASPEPRNCVDDLARLGKVLDDLLQGCSSMGMAIIITIPPQHAWGDTLHAVYQCIEKRFMLPQCAGV